MANATRSIGIGTGTGWPMVVGGALAGYGLACRSRSALPWALAGGGIIAATLSKARRCGQRAAAPYQAGIRVDQTMKIDKSPEKLYVFWRRPDNLPRFMDHLKSVTVLDDRHSHWVAKGPAGKRLKWDAEIINDRPNELIAWRSLPGSDVDHAGSVRFERTADGKTDIHVSLQYNPPGGMVGVGIAKLLGEDPQRTILEDLYRLKRMLESGEAGSLPRASSF